MGRQLYQCFIIWQMLLSVHGQNCPIPFIGYAESESCYYFAIGILKSWTGAQNFCRAKEGQLIKINDKAEETWIMTSLDTIDKNLIGEQEWWTALKRDPRNNNKWIWADNSQADTNLIRWGQGEPNNYLNNEHCAEIWSSTFNDKSCDMKLNFVCERSKDIPVKCDTNSGWEYHDGKCYRYFNIQLTRDQALLTCTGNQAELMSITTADEQETATLVAATTAKNIWLSRVYLEERSTWMIMSYPGSETPNNLFYWQKNEPTIYQGAQNCAALNYSAESGNNWYAENCTELNAFVCQRSAGICSPGFIKFQNRCYLFKQSTRLNWKDAKNYCERQNSSLLEIQSSIEEHFISNYIGMQRTNQANTEMVWIGLVPKRGIPARGTTQNLGDWLWISKTGYFSPMYLNMDMQSILPNSCAYFNTGNTNKWFYNMPCNTILPFVCYQYTTESNETRNPIPTTTPATPSTTPTASVPTKMSSKTDKTVQSSSVKAITTNTRTTVPTITTTAKPVTWDPLCGMFWEKDANSDNCYMLISQVSTWDNARTFCQTFNGELLSVTTVEEQFYLAGRFRQFSSLVDKIWIGAHSRGNKAGWQWTDGSPFAFFNFLKGEPNDKDQTQQCVAMDARYSKWSDELCTNLYPFACKKTVNKKKIPNIPPTSPPATSDDKYFGCQNGWSEYKLSCYLVVRNKTNWNQANSYCTSIGAGLVSIQNEAERNFVLSQLPKSSCYNIHINDDKCDEWESIGECDKNPVWMAKNCQKSCQSCLQDCKDEYSVPECQHWANLGECRSNPKWMLKNCALSCGICDSAIHGGFWIGLNDLKREMWFSWSDGSDVTFTAWAQSQPNRNTNGQDCVTMTLKDGRWSDYTCAEFMAGFVCKTPKKILPKATRSPLAIGCENESLGYNAMCYGFYEEKLSWDDAEKFCSDGNGHLATVNDRYVQAFLASQIVGKQGSFWIGLTQSYDTGLTDQWQDGQPVRFTHWSKSHTGKIEEDGFCVVMATSQPVGLWETMNCTILNSFICEFSRIGFTKPLPTTVTSTTKEPLKCSPGWKEKGSFCYKRFDEKKTWLDARSSCIRIGGNLVSIHSQEEGQFLFTNFSSGTCCNWIGFSDRDIEGGFKWSDGTPTDYTNWRYAEPNDAFNNEDCVYLATKSDYWNDYNCFIPLPYICKVPKGLPVFEDSPTTAAPTESCGKNSTWVFKNGKCYYFNRDNKPRTWYEAREYCLSQGGDLPSIHSKEEYNFFLYETSKNSLTFFWIGLNELQHKGFKWSDQSAVNFLLWGSGEPRNALTNMKCVGQTPGSGRWFGKICTYKFLSIVCARNKGSSNPVTMATTAVTPGGCPDGFSGMPLSNKCYKVVDRVDTWFNAEKACNAYGSGGHLASISNQVENAFLVTLMRNVGTNAWIGLHSMGNQRLYSWQDNSEVTYANWAPGEPNGNIFEKCIEFYSSENKAGGWNDVSCWKQRTYVCQTSRSIYFPTTASISDCPSGYQKFSSSCYKIQTTEMDWDTAKASCQIDLANLVSINDIYEQSFIDVYSRTIAKPFWIGLTAKNSSDLAWIDGWPYTYSRWADNEPSSQPDEKCTIIQDKKWKDTTCKLKLYSMCEKNSVKPPTTPLPGFCENGYSNYNGYCYYVEIGVQRPWDGAQSDCVKRNMNLASIWDEAEMEHLRNLVTQASGNSAVKKVWIGLTRKWKAGGSMPLGFYWQDGSELGYTNWDDGEPSVSYYNDNEKCTEMHANGRWNDVNCYKYNKPYICKAPERSGTTQSQGILTSESTLETTGAEFSKSPVPTALPSSSKATNSFPSNPLFPQRQSPQISKIDTDKATNLTPGQVVGICIGVVFVLSVIGVIGFLMWNKKKGASYNSEKQDRGFLNAMYMKSAENVSISDKDEGM